MSWLEDELPRPIHRRATEYDLLFHRRRKGKRVEFDRTWLERGADVVWLVACVAFAVGMLVLIGAATL